MADLPDHRPAEADKVHSAVARRGLWSPACSTQIGWVAPLASYDLPGQVTCDRCLALTERPVMRHTGPLKRTLADRLSSLGSSGYVKVGTNDKSEPPPHPNEISNVADTPAGEETSSG